MEAELEWLGHAVLESAAEAIIVSDREGAIRFWNAGVERLFDFSAAEALGCPLDIIVVDASRWSSPLDFPGLSGHRVGGIGLRSVPSALG